MELAHDAGNNSGNGGEPSDASLSSSAHLCNSFSRSAEAGALHRASGSGAPTAAARVRRRGSELLLHNATWGEDEVAAAVAT